MKKRMMLLLAAVTLWLPVCAAAQTRPAFGMRPPQDRWVRFSSMKTKKTKPAWRRPAASSIRSGRNADKGAGQTNEGGNRRGFPPSFVVPGDGYGFFPGTLSKKTCCTVQLAPVETFSPDRDCAPMSSSKSSSGDFSARPFSSPSPRVLTP